MLPAKQFRSLDAAMQSLRAAGMRLDWQWQDKDIGWVCMGYADDRALCALQPTQEPLVGQLRITRTEQKMVIADKVFPANFKGILKAPVEETKTECVYEFELSTTPERDMFSNFIEAVQASLSLDTES